MPEEYQPIDGHTQFVIDTAEAVIKKAQGRAVASTSLAVAVLSYVCRKMETLPPLGNTGIVELLHEIPTPEEMKQYGDKARYHPLHIKNPAVRI